ncbi:MAG: hypothetical protein V3S94_06445 [Gammaproteobacteria bacterium]
MAKLTKKGRQTSPVVIDGRKIARTFWGKAWCDNLERYSDFENRLPRGRSYVRNGSVVDLQAAAGRIAALVSGSALYTVTVTVAPLPRTRWSAVCKDCSGAIDSLVELLQGRFSNGVMARLCEKNTGLFPSPKEITFTCSCPDWASMCKHVAAVLYGIGARLDHQPELLFTLRKVDQHDLIAKAGSNLAKRRKAPARAKVLKSDDLADVFGIEIVPARQPKRAASGGIAPKPSAAARLKDSSKRATSTKPGKLRKRAPAIPAGTPAMTTAKRRAVSARMKKFWAMRRAARKKTKDSD